MRQRLRGKASVLLGQDAQVKYLIAPPDPVDLGRAALTHTLERRARGQRENMLDQRLDRVRQCRGRHDAGDADRHRLVPVLPPPPVAGHVRVGEVGQQPLAVHRQGENLLRAGSRADDPDGELGGEALDPWQRRPLAQLARVGWDQVQVPVGFRRDEPPDQCGSARRTGRLARSARA